MKKTYILLIFSLSLITSGILTSWIILNDFGRIVTTEVTFKTSDNVKIHATLQRPINVNSMNPAPAVIIIHGVYQSKEWLSAFPIELTKRGFVTLNIDALGHGNSDPLSYSEDRGAITAIEYLKELSFVNKIGIVGHSMGAGIAIDGLLNTDKRIDSMVFVGGGSRNMENWANNSYPNNLLITVGRYDELFNLPDLLESIKPIFNTTDEIEEGRIYGNFTMGTARKITIGGSNHLFETIDPVIITATVDWLQQSLMGKKEPVGVLIYPLFTFGGIISCIGILLSIIPIFNLIIEYKFFQSLQVNEEINYKISSKDYFIYGSAYGLISLSLLALMLFFSPDFPFVQPLGMTLSLWLISTAFISLGALILIIKRKSIIQWNYLPIDFENSKKNRIIFGKSALISLLIFGWLYMITLLFDNLLAIDFRVFLPLFNDLTWPRLSIIPFYLVVLIPSFMIEGIWLMGLLKNQLSDSTSLISILSKIGIKIAPFVLVLSLQILISILLDEPFIKGILGFYLLFLWMLIPFFVITTLIFNFTYQKTKKIYIGAILNAFIFSWVLASILTIY